jgi:ribosomal protein S18 acetylase RimI-like enzyme
MAALVDEIEIRPAELERDAPSIRALDTSFATEVIFEVQSDARGFRLVERPVDPPLLKSFPLEHVDGSQEWQNVWLAFDRGEAVGVVATQNDGWNRRAKVWHLYVNPEHRRRGIARRLLETALAAAREAGARTAWLETSNLNVPGVRAYERLGFRLCGLDTSLYDGTPAEREVALFLCRSLVDRDRS